MAASGPAERAGDTSRPIFAWLCIVIAVLEGFDLQVAGVVAPRVAASMHLGADALGLFFSASTFGLLFGALAGGWAADRLGRIPVLAGSVFAFGVASVLNGLASTGPELILARFATGLGLGGALPNLIALTSENARPGRQKRAVAYLYCGVPIGGMLVSLAGAFFGDAWRLLFFAGGIVPVAVGIALWALGKRGTSGVIARPVQEIGAIAALFHERRAVPTILVWTSFCATLIVLYLVLNWLPLLLSGMGFSAKQALFAQLAFNGGGFLACLLTAPLLDSPRAWIIALGAFLAVPILLYAMSLVAVPVTGIALALLLGGAILTTQSFLYAMAPTIYPVGTGGTGTGAAVAWGRIGSIAGPLYGTALLSGNAAERDVLAGLVPIALVAGVSAVALALRLRGQLDQVATL
ncbi:MAG: MFS transporter [Novosphingobium sp.]